MNVGSRYSLTAEINRQKKLSDSITQLQTDISSGIKIHVASDDPVAARRIAQIRGTQASQAVYSTNITTATQTASQVEDSLSSVQNALVSAKELILQANTGTASSTDRNAIATELQTLADTIKTASKATDASGTPIYTVGGAAAAIPVGSGVNIQAAAGYDDVFGAVTLASGSTALADGSQATLASILASAITALQSNDAAGIAAASNNIDSAQTHIATALTDAGGRSKRLQLASDRLDTAKIELENERSGLEDTDLTTASSDLVQKKTMLDAAQAVLAQLSRTTLFDRLS